MEDKSFREDNKTPLDGFRLPEIRKPHYMEIKDMYRAVNKDFDWGFVAYQVPKKYYSSRSLSPPEKIKKSKVALDNEKKIQKKTYLDDQLRLQKDIPGPNTYNISKDWAAGLVKKPDHLTKLEDPSKKGKLTRETIFDSIIRLGDKEKPGPGTYFETKPLPEEMKQKLEPKKDAVKRWGESSKLAYIGESEYLGVATPGPGDYEVKTVFDVRAIKTVPRPSPDELRKKLEEERKKFIDKKREIPDCGFYDPMPLNFSTFSRIEKEKRLISHPVDPFKRNIDKKSDPYEGGGSIVGDRGFGKSPRILHNFKSKSPGPGNYDVDIRWEGKDEANRSFEVSKVKKVRDWSKVVSKKPEKSIYYES